MLCQRVLKMFPGPGYLRSEDEVVRLWHLEENLCIYIYIYIYIYIPITCKILLKTLKYSLKYFI